MRSRESLDILWNKMASGDLVLAWQTDRRAAVGLCRVSRFDDWTDRSGTEQREMILELLGEPFSPPIPLLDLRKTDPAVARVRAFEQGFAGTLYETTPREAQVLLRTCNARSLALDLGADTPRRATAPGSRSGGGFGSAAQNAKVEAAAIDVFKREYASWSLSDVQQNNVGYDFRATKGRRERHVEVKGVSGPMPSFVITTNEKGVAETDEFWHLLVVVDALSKIPRVMEWPRDDFLLEFEFTDMIRYMARLRQ
jgi:hypothetical protein